MLHIKWRTVLCVCHALFVAGYIAGSCNKRNTSNTAYRERIDTAHTLVTVSIKPLLVSAKTNRTKTIRIHDTIFTARCIDTVIASDTLSICYARDEFTIALHFAARQLPMAIPYVARDSIITDFSTRTRPWYEDVLMVIVSIAAGMVLGRLN
jgi:hypothetical protein